VQTNGAIEYDPTVSSIIAIQGALGAEPEKLIIDLMAIVASKIGVQLCQGPYEKALSAGQRRQFVDATGKCTGSVRLVLTSADEVQRLKASIHSTAIEVNGSVQHVEVHNSLLETPIPKPAAAYPQYENAGSSSDAATPGTTEQPGNGVGSRNMQAAVLPSPPPGLD
jgi:hypothetical protein